MKTLLILAHELMIDGGNIGGEVMFYEECSAEAPEELGRETASYTWLKVTVGADGIVSKLETKTVWKDYRAVDDPSWTEATEWKYDLYGHFNEDEIRENRVAVGEKIGFEFISLADKAEWAAESATRRANSTSATA